MVPGDCTISSVGTTTNVSRKAKRWHQAATIHFLVGIRKSSYSKTRMETTTSEVFPGRQLLKRMVRMGTGSGFSDSWGRRVECGGTTSCAALTVRRPRQTDTHTQADAERRDGAAALELRDCSAIWGDDHQSKNMREKGRCRGTTQDHEGR